MTRTVLILGPSGKIGTHAARAFSAAGWEVRSYRRGTDMTAAAIGAAVIVNGLNPPNYHDWARQVPRITAQVIAAARASGATVMVPGNVYVFGDEAGTWDETTPHRATTRKGRIRVEMERAYRESGVRTIVLRAGDFIDPDGKGDLLSVVVLKRLAKGRITALGPADVPRAHVWLPDWAATAVALADRRDTLARFEDVPMPGLTVSIRHLADEIGRQTGRTPRIERFPWWLMTLAAPVWELAREMREMRYLFATPHALGGDRLARLVPDAPSTPLSDVVTRLLAGQVDPDQPVRSGRQSVLAE